MSRRAKELFEVLAVKECPARPEGPRSGDPRPRRKRAADPDAAAARAGIGGRSFPLTVNQGLLIAVLLVLTNAASFVVGKRQGSPDSESPALRREGPRATYSVRAWTDHNRADNVAFARKLAQVLERHYADVNVYEVNEGRYVAIDVGRWTERNAPGLGEAERFIRTMKDKDGRKPLFPAVTIVEDRKN